MCYESPDALLPGLEGSAAFQYPMASLPPPVLPSRDKLCRLAQLCPACTTGSEHVLPKLKKSKPLADYSSFWPRADMYRVPNSSESLEVGGLV